MSQPACGRQMHLSGSSYLKELFMKSFVSAVGTFIEVLREVFCDPDKPPLGGAAAFV